MDQDLYFISVAARMLGMHPQTLRKYERLGLVQPTRTIGSMRLYSREELERLKIIKRLVQERPTGKLFLNLRGRPWTAAAVKDRFRRLEKTIGGACRRLSRTSIRRANPVS